MKNHEKIKKKTAINNLLPVFLLCSPILFLVSHSALSNRENLMGAICFIVGAAFLIIPWCFMPILYRFDAKGVSLVYLFFPEERYLWKNIMRIYEDDDSSDTSIFNLFFMEYVLVGRVEGKHRRYMHGKIQKSRKTKRLIKEYWSGSIEGYFDDLKHIIKRKKKK